MAYKNKKPDVAVTGTRILILFFAVGMLYFPYQAGKKFFKPYLTGAAKFKGFFCASFYLLLGIILDIFVFNFLVPALGSTNSQPQPQLGDLLTHPAGWGVFAVLFLVGAIMGYLAKKDAEALAKKQ